MSGDPRRRAFTGEPLRIPAPTWNDMLDLLDRKNPEAGRRVVRPRARQLSVLPVQNGTQADVPRFGILGLGPPVTTPDAEDQDKQDEFETRVIFGGHTPSESTDFAKFVICPDGIEAGHIGAGMFFGMTPVKLLVNDSHHTCADVLDGDVEKLQTAVSGSAQVLWMESQDNEDGWRWAVVRVGVPPVPFRAITGVAMVEDLDPDAQHPGQTYATIGHPSAQTNYYVEPEDEHDQVLLLRLDYPIYVTPTTRFHVPVYDLGGIGPICKCRAPQVTLDPGTRATLSVVLRMEGIVDDFDVSGDECAAWTDYDAWTTYKIADVEVGCVESSGSQLPQRTVGGTADRSAISAPMDGTAAVIGHTITGIAIRLVHWKAALGANADQFQSIFRVLTSEGFVAGKW
jgi:hypothetical protein